MYAQTGSTGRAGRFAAAPWQFPRCHRCKAWSSSGKERCSSRCQYGQSWVPGP